MLYCLDLHVLINLPTNADITYPSNGIHSWKRNKKGIRDYSMVVEARLWRGVRGTVGAGGGWFDGVRRDTFYW